MTPPSSSSRVAACTTGIERLAGADPDRRKARHHDSLGGIGRLGELQEEIEIPDEAS